jgi:CBS domain-containing protein
MNLNYYTVESSGTLLNAVEAIARNKSRCVVVIEHDKAVGVISEGDLVRALLRGTDIYSPMYPFINHGFVFLSDRDFGRALMLFQTHGISLIPILDEMLKLTDVLTLSDVLVRVRLDELKGSL